MTRDSTGAVGNPQHTSVQNMVDLDTPAATGSSPAVDAPRGRPRAPIPRWVWVIAAVVVVTLAAVGVAVHSNRRTSSTATATAPPAATSTVDAAFQAKVLATCSTWAADSSAHPFPIPTLDPDHVTPADLRVIAAWATTQPSRADQWSALARLGTPRTGTQTWAEVLSVVTQAVAVAGDQEQAVTTADTTRYIGDYHQLDDLLTDDLPSALVAAGFSPTNSCQSYFVS